MTAKLSNCSRKARAVISPARGKRSNSSNIRQLRRQWMNWDQIQGDWVQFKAGVRGNWVKITDEDLTRIGGRREELIRRLQARYGFSKNEADARD